MSEKKKRDDALSEIAESAFQKVIELTDAEIEARLIAHYGSKYELERAVKPLLDSIGTRLDLGRSARKDAHAWPSVIPSFDRAAVASRRPEPRRRPVEWQRSAPKRQVLADAPVAVRFEGRIKLDDPTFVSPQWSNSVVAVRAHRSQDRDKVSVFIQAEIDPMRVAKGARDGAIHVTFFHSTGEMVCEAILRSSERLAAMSISCDIAELEGWIYEYDVQ